MLASRKSFETTAKLAALDRVQAIIEFDLNGTILTANENFCGAVGYSLSEIVGKHHSMFVGAAERDSEAYRDFWTRLNTVNSSPASISVSARAAGRSLSRPPTIRSAISTAIRSRS